MMLVALLDADPELDVAGWATNGEQAIRATAMLKPDVITMDLQMPGLDGLEATRRIMLETPTPIVLVSSSATRENRQLAFEAFEAGVLAVLEKPANVSEAEQRAQELLRTVKSMARVKVIRRWAQERLRPPALPEPAAVKPGTRSPEVVAVGASTGGPQALLEILSRLPATFSLPVLVVQHIAPGFTAGLVEWLRPHCALPIQVVRSELPADRPGIYVAPAGQHLVVRGRSLALTSAPPVSGHQPSATVLFQSVAHAYGAAAIGVLLTGMGEDGAAGLRDLKRAGGVTIAQDEESSIVFGMPAVAIGMGVVDYVLPPAAIGPLLAELQMRARRLSGWT
ncbi:MAG: chemotaxis-specific protein-glutamate methyltransferase CheB [Chloroflexi bacterium]|nr:chemotaxis-specific protein-glutamate methyltransferase CheB [Chloroflexota bacterium]